MTALSAALDALDDAVRARKARLAAAGEWFACDTTRDGPADADALAALAVAVGPLPAAYRDLLALTDGYHDGLDDPAQVLGLFSIAEVLEPEDDVVEWQHADPDDAVATRARAIGRYLDVFVLLDGDRLVTIDSERELVPYDDLTTLIRVRTAALLALRP
ncbi:MAG: hypothetical protein ABMB14_20805 [Myxococcota bacterium]